MSRPTLEQAKSVYGHRFTAEHVPTWAKRPLPDGRYYAPQYRTDKEWYDNTVFPGEPGCIGGKHHCTTLFPSWPIGQWLTAAFDPRSLPEWWTYPAASWCNKQHPTGQACFECGPTLEHHIAMKGAHGT